MSSKMVMSFFLRSKIIYVFEGNILWTYRLKVQIAVSMQIQRVLHKPDEVMDVHCRANARQACG